ncbi:Topoisomerase 1-associated factor 1 [Dissophora ornata]|nr:Topoisomerase 1-associated factor 1 [Dissophora ornata]
MDPDTESLLVSTCMALGGFEDISMDMDDTRQQYIMGDECLECLKDIKKFIKYYDEPGDNVVLTYLGKMGILEKDLIPIILLNTPASSPVRERLVLACVELIVPMTWPIDYKALQTMVIREEDSSLVGNLHERLEILRGYKRAFLKPGVLGAVFAVMLRPLEVEHRMRTTRDQAVIRLGLSLFRNLVAIPDSQSSISGTMDQFISSIMQEELLERFQQENIMALLTTLASCATDAQMAEWNAITLEIFYYIFSGIDAEELVPAVSGKAKNSQLQDLLNKEEKEKKSQSTAGRKRHDRFGTTGEVRLQDGTRMVLHQKGALFTSFESQLDTIKKPRAKARRHKEMDQEHKKSISRNGTIMLRSLALTVLEIGFNPLFTSLRRDIEMERDKMKEHHRGQYHYLIGFMLTFQRQYADYLTRQYHEDKKHTLQRQLESLEAEYQENASQCDFDAVAVVIEVPCVFQVIHFIRNLMEEKPKDRLMTLYVMIKSPQEKYRDASDIVQNNLYYEEATLELLLELAKSYTTQSNKYLNSVVRMVHILLKTLESYSNSKSHMYIRKTRLKVKKRKDDKKAAEAAKKSGDQQPGEGEDSNEAVEQEEQPMDDVQQEDGEDQEGQPENDGTHVSKDHKFVFKEFERRFANESVVHTYCAFLENFMELDETQMHWAASLFHRIAVNCRNNAVFYKLSTLQLFHRILQSNKEDTKKDLVPLISYLLHQFFKKMQEYPLLIVELFFPRTSRSCLEINVGRDEAEKGEQLLSEKKEKRKGDTLKGAVEKRHLMTLRTESELAENPDLMYSVENVEDILIKAENPAMEHSFKVLPRFRLLLKLLKFVKEDVDSGIQYIIPKDLPTDTIAEYHDMVEAILQSDASFEHYDYSALITKINKTKKPSGTGSKRTGQRQESIKEVAVYHSAEYIVDSEEEDDAYFDAEKRLREKTRIDFAQAEERHRRMEAENAKSKSQKQKDMLVKKFGKSDAKSTAPGTLTDSDQSEDVDQENRPPPVPLRGVGLVESDDESLRGDDEDGDDDDERRRAPRTLSDVGSDNDDARERAKISQAIPRQQYTSQRRMIQLDSDESDGDKSENDGGDEDDADQATQPLSLTQRLAAQTGSKRRIILEDSDDEEMGQSDHGGSQGSNDPPARKKLAFEGLY